MTRKPANAEPTRATEEFHALKGFVELHGIRVCLALLRETDPSHQVLEARIGTQAVEMAVHFEE